MKEIGLQSGMLIILKKEIQTRLYISASEHIVSIWKAYFRAAKVAQPVKLLTIDFGLGHNLGVMESSPCVEPCIEPHIELHT